MLAGLCEVMTLGWARALASATRGIFLVSDSGGSGGRMPPHSGGFGGQSPPWDRFGTLSRKGP